MPRRARDEVSTGEEEMQTHEEIMINRSDQQSLRFLGREIGYGTNRYLEDGSERRRWLLVVIYEAIRDDEVFYVGKRESGGESLGIRVFTAEATTPRGLLKLIAKPDYRDEGKRLFIHSSIRQAFEQAASVNPDFTEALIVDLT